MLVLFRFLIKSLRLVVRRLDSSELLSRIRELSFIERRITTTLLISKAYLPLVSLLTTFCPSNVCLTDLFSGPVANVTGCTEVDTQLACLRAIPYANFTTYLTTAGVGHNWPIPDGDFYTGTTMTNFRHHKAAQIPLVIGVNKDEGTGKFLLSLLRKGLLKVCYTFRWSWITSRSTK